MAEQRGAKVLTLLPISRDIIIGHGAIPSTYQLCYTGPAGIYNGSGSGSDSGYDVIYVNYVKYKGHVNYVILNVPDVPDVNEISILNRKLQKNMRFNCNLYN